MPESDAMRPSFTARYIISAIAIRIIVRMVASHENVAEDYAIPLIGALALSYAWPHVLARRTFESQSQEQEEMRENELSARFIDRKAADIGPISFIGVPRLTNEQERRLEQEQRIERVVEMMSTRKEDLLTPEENEEAFQVYMHCRMRQAHSLPASPLPDEVQKKD